LVIKIIIFINIVMNSKFLLNHHKLMLLINYFFQ